MKKSAPSWKLLVVLIFLVSLALVGCGRISRQLDAAPDVTVTLDVSPDPPSIGPANLTLAVKGADGRPIDGAQLQIKGDMTHAGMQPVLAKIGGGRGGVYQTPFEWTMGGDWILTVTAALPDGRTTARQFSYTVKGDICGPDGDVAQTEAAEGPE
jgi:hypothetical protein